MVRMPRSALETFLLISLIFLAPVAARADLRFAQPTADAGEVKAGTPLAHPFDFVNDGPEPVEITAVHASCGCLTPRLAQRVYQPGERGTLLLEVNTLSQPAGSNHWKIQVAWRSGPQSQEVVLGLTARVITEIIVQPPAMTVFADAGVVHAILLTDLRSRPLSVVEVRSSSPRLKARLLDEYRDDAGHVVHKVKLDVGGDYPEGRHDETVTIFTNDAAYRELKVLVTIIKQARQRFSASPNPVHLVGQAGQPIPSRLVLIRDREGQAVGIDQVISDHPGVHCTWASGPGPMATVKITVDRSRVMGGVLKSILHVHIGKPIPEVVHIPLACTMSERP